MYRNIFCVMFGGVALTDEVRNFLLRTSIIMAKEDSRVCEVKEEMLEGVVRTEFKRGFMGYLSGIIFSAEVESDQGNTKVDYIVRDADLASINPDEFDGLWMNFNPAMVRQASNN